MLQSTFSSSVWDKVAVAFVRNNRRFAVLGNVALHFFARRFTESSCETHRRFCFQAKASGKKLQRVSLAVSLRGIRMTDLATEEDQLQVSIYRRVLFVYFQTSFFLFFSIFFSFSFRCSFILSRSSGVRGGNRTKGCTVHQLARAMYRAGRAVTLWNGKKAKLVEKKTTTKWKLKNIYAFRRI